MTSNHRKSVSFLYEINSAVTSPSVSTHNTSNMMLGESRGERATRLRAEWPHDRQPPEHSPYYPSSSNGSTNSKKGQSRASQESVPDSNPDEEVVKSSLPSSPEHTTKRSKHAIVRQVTQPVVVPTVEGDRKSHNAEAIIRIDEQINRLEKRIFEGTKRKHRIEKDIAHQHTRKIFIDEEIVSLQEEVLVLKAKSSTIRKST
jgi:hypothetical protein